jgi:ArsR family transcriptional regulator, arsenate/arsenite/antimonite-responsive transcriptional repressor
MQHPTPPEAVQPPAETLALRLGALSHPARIAILKHLSAAGCCCCKDVVRSTHLAQSTVSQHLKVLVEAGLVRYTPDRQRSRYEIDGGALAELSGAFADLIQSCCSESACCGQRQDREETWQTKPYRPSPARR